ncbi:hypothetical protein TeGR_g3876 [Tetraparma gracilis]|uniref:Uncharacterized protein n=1 Tax=Tetraparma gracilis TaxID=2962635 RepID=A0ABQ6MGL5_9STRA|nr:hypothetical protein TeGR_g3876 [Tetraparma gracilis]
MFCCGKGEAFTVRRDSYWEPHGPRHSSVCNEFTNRQFMGWAVWLLAVVPLAVVQVLSIGPYITYLARLNSEEDQTSLFGSILIPYDSYWSYLTTVSILLMALSTLVGGPLADVTPRRKDILIFTTLLGGCVLPLIIIFLPSTGKFWHFVPLVYLPSTALTNLAGVIWHSYLIDMVPESQRAMRLAQSFLMAAVGFVVFGGVAVFIEGLHDPCSGDADVCVDGELPEGAANPQMEAIVTYTMPIACAWGMACLLFVHHALPPLAASRKPSRPSLIGEAFNNLRVTAKKLGKFPQTSWYLANEAVVACGDTTIATLFSVIALDKLGLASADVAQVMSVSIVFVVTSNMIAGVLMKRELLTPIKLIIIGRSGTVLNSLYFAFYVRDLKTFWISGIFFGCFNGLLGVTSTQLFSSLVPPVYKSEFFALRSVNAKLLAWIGPLLFAVVTTAGSFELAVASLGLYTVAGTVLLLRVDVARGMDAALNFEEEEEEEEEGGVGVGAGGVELTKQITTKEHTMVLV